MIFFDNVISRLQNVGGISVLFRELWTRFSLREIPYTILDNTSAASDGWRVLERYRDCRMPSGMVLDNYLFHSTYYRLCDRKGGKVVTTVHDFTYERAIGGIRRIVHSAQKYRAIRNSDIVICVSQNTKKDLLEYMPDISEDRLRVIYNGASDVFRPIELLGVGAQDSVLFVGQRGGYKNFDSLVRALGMFSDIRLMCVGGGPLNACELKFLEKYLPDRYQHLGYISNEQLNETYNRASCLIYPSLYEGFGIPVLEAMRAGCPVVALNSSSIPEVAGDAAILLSSAAPEEIKDAIEQAMGVNARDELRRRGFAQARKFSWDRTADETLSVYRELVGDYMNYSVT